MFRKFHPIEWRPLMRLAERLAQPLGLVLSLVLLAVVLRQALTADWSLLSGSASLSASFWAVLCLYYFITPATEWLIYSRLWGFHWSIFPALLRKMVGNELLLDYVGDAHFLVWAQSRPPAGSAAFGAIKDTTLLSALTGNLITVALTALAWPFFAQVTSSLPGRTVLLSLAIVLAVSCGFLLLGKRLFTHPRPTLVTIGAVLTLRTLAALLLNAVMWHLLMPGSSLELLFLLATFRMIVSRLPLVPNKELLFAGLTLIVLGRSADVSVATSMIASLILVLHLATGTFLAITHLGLTRKRGKNASRFVAKRHGTGVESASDADD